MKLFLKVFLLLTLTGCISFQTKYKPVDFWGNGYQDIKITKDSYRVIFTGNSSTAMWQVENMALYRAAEIAIENGYKYFKLITDSTGVDMDMNSYIDTNEETGETFSSSSSSSSYQVSYLIKLLRKEEKDTFKAEEVLVNLPF